MTRACSSVVYFTRQLPSSLLKSLWYPFWNTTTRGCDKDPSWESKSGGMWCLGLDQENLACDRLTCNKGNMRKLRATSWPWHQARLPVFSYALMPFLAPWNHQIWTELSVLLFPYCSSIPPQMPLGQSSLWSCSWRKALRVKARPTRPWPSMFCRQNMWWRLSCRWSVCHTFHPSRLTFETWVNHQASREITMQAFEGCKSLH